jgi:hypothetical protein
MLPVCFHCISELNRRNFNKEIGYPAKKKKKEKPFKYKIEVKEIPCNDLAD